MGKSTFHYDKGAFKIKVTSDIKKKFDKYQKMLLDPTGAYTRMMSDLKSRVPGQVADAVREVYIIKRGEILPSKKKTKIKKAGYIGIKGQTLADLKLYYEGRTLTFMHFAFTKKIVKKAKNYKTKPNEDKSKRHNYKVTLKVKKSGNFYKHKSLSKKEYGSPFIFRTPQGLEMPFHRIKGTTNSENKYYIKTSKKHKGEQGRPNERIESIRSLSLPQMVDNRDVRKVLSPALSKLVEERFNHHFSDYNHDCINKINSIQG